MPYSSVTMGPRNSPKGSLSLQQTLSELPELSQNCSDLFRLTAVMRCSDAAEDYLTPFLSEDMTVGSVLSSMAVAIWLAYIAKAKCPCGISNINLELKSLTCLVSNGPRCKYVRSRMPITQEYNNIIQYQ